MSLVHACRAYAGAALFLLCCAPGALGHLVRRPLHPRSEVCSRAVAGRSNGGWLCADVQVCADVFCVCTHTHTPVVFDSSTPLLRCDLAVGGHTPGGLLSAGTGARRIGQCDPRCVADPASGLGFRV